MLKRLHFIYFFINGAVFYASLLNFKKQQLMSALACDWLKTSCWFQDNILKQSSFHWKEVLHTPQFSVQCQHGYWRFFFLYVICTLCSVLSLLLLVSDISRFLFYSPAERNTVKARCQSRKSKGNKLALWARQTTPKAHAERGMEEEP